MTTTNFTGLIASHDPSDIYSSDFFLIKDKKLFDSLNKSDENGKLDGEAYEKLDEMLGRAISEKTEDVQFMKTAPYELVEVANGFYLGELYYKLAKNRGLHIDALKKGGSDVFLRVKDILMDEHNIPKDNYIYVNLML